MLQHKHLHKARLREQQLACLRYLTACLDRCFENDEQKIVVPRYIDGADLDAEFREDCTCAKLFGASANHEAIFYNFSFASESRHREEGKHSHKLFENVRVNVVLFVFWDFGWVSWAFRKSEECRKPQPPLLLKRVLQYTSNLYCNTPPIGIAVLSVPLSLGEREILQYSSHLYRSAPPICIAMRLPFVSQYASHLYRNTLGKILVVGVTGMFPRKGRVTDPYRSPNTNNVTFSTQVSSMRLSIYTSHPFSWSSYCLNAYCQSLKHCRGRIRASFNTWSLQQVNMLSEKLRIEYWNVQQNNYQKFASKKSLAAWKCFVLSQISKFRWWLLWLEESCRKYFSEQRHDQPIVPYCQSTQQYSSHFAKNRTQSRYTSLSQNIIYRQASLGAHCQAAEARLPALSIMGWVHKVVLEVANDLCLNAGKQFAIC